MSHSKYMRKTRSHTTGGFYLRLPIDFGLGRSFVVVCCHPRQWQKFMYLVCGLTVAARLGFPFVAVIVLKVFRVELLLLVRVKYSSSVPGRVFKKGS